MRSTHSLCFNPVNVHLSGRGGWTTLSPGPHGLGQERKGTRAQEGQTVTPLGLGDRGTAGIVGTEPCVLPPANN